jgi:membrane fusion protein, multidrug efflux system
LVKDPLSLENLSEPPLLVNSYVRVEIEGKVLSQVFPVKRDYLRNGDNLWVMNEDQKMEIIPVEVAFRDKQFVYLSNGIKVGDKIVTTDISTPVAGMPLRVNDNVPTQAKDNFDASVSEVQQ